MGRHGQGRSVARVAGRRSLGLACLALVGVAALASQPAAAEEPWGFEQVTPANKGAGAVSPDTFRTSPDGNSFLMTATGSFDAAPAESLPAYVRYLASRGADGWAHRPLDPPTQQPLPAINATVMQTVGSSADLSYVLVASRRALAPGATDGGGNLYMRNTATGAYTLVATSENQIFARQFMLNLGAFAARYVAPDGRAALFISGVPLVPGAPGNPATGQDGALYSWTAEEGVRAASVLPEDEGGAIVSASSAVGGTTDSGVRSALPERGGVEHIYFSPPIGGGPGPVYVRTGDETKAVSVSRIEGDSTDPVPGRVLATASGGRYMLFSTPSRSTSQGGAYRLTVDTPTNLVNSPVLYRYDAVDDDLTYIGASGINFTIPDWVDQMSQDGRTVAFESVLELTDGATPGLRNKYIWRDGTLRLVAAAEDGSVGAEDGWQMRVLSSNGRYFAFTDNSTGPASAAARAGVDLGDASPACADGGTPRVCEQVFVFDADANGGTGELECASCRPDGLQPAGPGGDPDWADSAGFIRMDTRQMQTVADDGTTFFTSPDGLVAGDANGLTDVYAYRDGEQRLLSRARPGASARLLDITPDGKTVFFATNDAIAPTDTDRSIDVYMTRAGAGFPYTPPVVVPPCVGGECRDPFAGGGSAAPAIGSLAFTAPDGGAAGPARPSLRVAKRRAVRGARAMLRVRVPSAGSIRVSGPAVRRANRRTTRAATYRLRVTLSARARRALSRRGRFKARVGVVFRARGGDSARRVVTVTFKRPKPGRRASRGRR